MADSSLLSRLDGIEARFEEVSTLINDPSVISDMKRYVRLTKEYKDLEKLTKATRTYRELIANIDEAHEILASENDAEMREMAREQLDSSSQRLPELEEQIKLLLIPADPEDSKNAILEIRGGTGGDEAAIFAGDLCKMYIRYCESRGWNVAITSASEGAAGGYKEVVLSVTGEGVYGTLKYESGVHRVQRVPATETQGRVHTSAATVAVLPEAQPFDVEINEGEIKWDTFRSGGAGGQNVNKVESGVRLRYMWRNPNTQRPKKSSSSVPRHATSQKTKNALSAAYAHSSTTKNIRNISTTSHPVEKPWSRPATAQPRYAPTTTHRGASPTIASTTPFITFRLLSTATFRT